MPTVNGNKGANHFPAPTPPGINAQNVQSGAQVGTSVWPHNSTAAAGVSGNITINGQTIALDLTVHELENVVSRINAVGGNTGVVASIDRFGRLSLTSTGGINLGGSNAVLAALGLA